MSDVTFRKVSKYFGAVTALDNLDLEIKSGEFISLLGPSGSGKSTTLSLLAGIQTAGVGEIMIDGRVVNHLTPDKRNIAMVFQNYALYPHMTIWENLAFPLRAPSRRMPDRAIRPLIEKVSETLGLADLLHRTPKELSGGQQQRVALGRAMIRDPGVFLLDEPLSNLDVRLRIKMRRDIKALHDRVRGTTIYVTHDQSEALGLSDRIAVFNKGKLQQFSSPESIYNRPVNMFVANFVGEREMNFLSGALTEKDGGVLFSSPLLKTALETDIDRASLPKENACTLGLRSEAIRPASGNEAPDFIGSINGFELSGPDQIIFVRLSDNTEISCRMEVTHRVQRGENIGLVVRRDRMNFFDPISGMAILGPNSC